VIGRIQLYRHLVGKPAKSAIGLAPVHEPGACSSHAGQDGKSRTGARKSDSISSEADRAFGEENASKTRSSGAQFRFRRN
jgi:hypothetical protein